MTWAGGRVTLSAFGGPRARSASSTAAPTCHLDAGVDLRSGLTRHFNVHLHSNDSSHPVHYRFILTPGDLPGRSHGVVPTTAAICDHEPRQTRDIG